MLKLSNTEMKNRLFLASENARKEARENGVPFVYMWGNKMIKEYPSGEKRELIITSKGKKEIEYVG
jgi:hypothetical protein